MTVETARELHKDQRGAIMLMGLCMSCFLIGGLWFLIGIGDSIVFRDNMQEAADHAAFTSAVIHAKGMNFISACNLILLALIAIHIVMGLIHDILLAICIIFAVPSLGSACSPYTTWRPIYHGYGKGFKQVANVIHYLEQGAAIGYPFVGLAKAYTLGNDYGEFGPKKHKVNVIAVSTSLIPGSVMSGAVNKLFGQKPAEKLPSGVEGPTRPASGGYSEGTKSFLPVEVWHFDAVCRRVASSSIEFLVGLTGMTIPGPVLAVFKGLISAGVIMRYCNDLGSGGAQGAMDSLTGAIGGANGKIDEANAKNRASTPEGQTPPDDIAKIKLDGVGGLIDPGFDTWWGKDGPFLPWRGTWNGSPWQQIWSMNLLPEFADAQQHRVHVGANNKHVESDAKAWGYFAQAEYFFDCAKDWGDVSCNGDRNAGFSIKWRARLRRLQLPQMGSLLTSFAGEFLRNTAGYKAFKSGGAANLLGSITGGSVSRIQTALGALFPVAEGQATGVIRDAGGGLDGVQNGILNLGAYH